MKTAAVSKVSALVWWWDTEVPKPWNLLSVIYKHTERPALDSVFFHLKNRLQARVALSYLSLNTYQNQLELHNNSKQAIFLMANVIDAWQWVSQCSLLTLNKKINLNYLTVLFISIQACEGFRLVLLQIINLSSSADYWEQQIQRPFALCIHYKG